MIFCSKVLKLNTLSGVDIIDLNAEVKNLVAESKVRNGIVMVFTKHTTTGIKIAENEMRLLVDMKLYLEKTAPLNGVYLHDNIHLRQCPADERINGHAHIKAMELNSNENIPIINSELVLGKWQSILFFELDG